MAAIHRATTTVDRYGVRERTVEPVEEAAAAAPGLPFSLELIPSSVHGFFDYFIGLGALAAPWMFGFAHIAPARLVVQLQGATVLSYSLLTNYEWGVVRILPFRTHLLFDFLGGIFLAASPWLLGFPRRGRMHLLLGLFELAITLLTRRRVGLR